MSENIGNELTGWAALIIGLLFLSHLCWYVTTYVVCEVTVPVPFRCFVGSIIGFFMLIGSMPANAFFLITEFTVGTSYAFNTWLSGLIFFALLAFRYRSVLLDSATAAASYTITAEPKDHPTRPDGAVPSRKSLEQDIERQ